MSICRPAVYLAGVLLCAGPALAQDEVPSYVKDIQPFLTKYCVSCHKSGNAKGGISIDSYDALLKAARKGRKLVVPGQPDESRLVTTTEGKARPVMPPKNAKARPTEKETAMLRAWVAAGAKDDTPAPTAASRPRGWALEATRVRLVPEESREFAAFCER
jgi:hypothetical protein